MTIYRNVGDAFASLLRVIVQDGHDVTVRDNGTKEILAQLIELEQATERCLFIAGRNNNIFATIAESMWVLAGRNDLGYLSPYLSRAKDFSDDGGKTWRAGYGPRLRNWNGVDQLSQIVRLLRSDPTSRRAVITLYDPDLDFVASNDIPCNNWLHFIARDGKLHLHVAARSTDIWWGFSGINAFEWTLLLEMMSHWVGLKPGRLAFFTSSLHLYERHFAQAGVVLNSAQNVAATYPARRSAFSTPWEIFDDALVLWMELERQIRDGADLDDLPMHVDDPLLQQYIQMIDLYWTFKRGADDERLRRKVASLGNTDLALAAAEFIARQNAQQH